MYEQEFLSETSNGTTESSTSTSTSALKDKVSGQASEWKSKITSQANSLGSQLGQKIDTARGKTSQRLKSTSQRIHNLATYMEDHDAKDMSDAVVSTSKELIRKHPGKALLAGVLAGLLVGRILNMGSSSRL